MAVAAAEHHARERCRRRVVERHGHEPGCVRASSRCTRVRNRALVSSVNFVAGQTVANAVIAPLSPGGEICFFSNVDTDVIVDISGWFPAESGYAPAAAPARVLDTRAGESPDALRDVPKQQIGGTTELRVQMTEPRPTSRRRSAWVPSSLNVTVTNPVGPGFVTVYPCGRSPGRVERELRRRSDGGERGDRADLGRRRAVLLQQPRHRPGRRHQRLLRHHGRLIHSTGLIETVDLPAPPTLVGRPFASRHRPDPLLQLRHS